jgi:hypothetical protein
MLLYIFIVATVPFLLLWREKFNELELVYVTAKLTIFLVLSLQEELFLYKPFISAMLNLCVFRLDIATFFDWVSFLNTRYW